MIATLAEIKSYLGVSGSADDAFLTSQGQLVSDAIEAYCQRKFNAVNYTQTYYCEDYKRGDSRLFLAVFPVNSITSIEEDGEAITGYRLHPQTGILTKKEGFFFGDEIIVEYNAGYAQADIPSVVKSVVYSVVGERYSKKKSGIDLNFGSDVQRVSIPGTISIDFDYTLTNSERKNPFGSLLGNYLNLLDHYRSDQAVVGSTRLTYVAE